MRTLIILLSFVIYYNIESHNIKPFDDARRIKTNIAPQIGDSSTRRYIKSDQKILTSGNLKVNDDFKVYYPPNYKAKSAMTDARGVSNGPMPLLLSGLVNGLYGECNPSIELSHGSLYDFLNRIITYLSEVMEHMRSTLREYFEAIDKNLENDISLPIIEYGDVLF